MSENYEELFARSNETLPESFDLRDYGLSPAVKNQDIKSLCWAFSTLGTLESSIMAQFPQVDFSEKHLGWDSRTGDEEEDIPIHLFQHWLHGTVQYMKVSCRTRILMFLWTKA